MKDGGVICLTKLCFCLELKGSFKYSNDYNELNVFCFALINILDVFANLLFYLDNTSGIT